MTLTRSHYAYLAVIGALLAAMFWNHSQGMYVRWFKESSYYSHGFMIPFVSVYLIWRMRESLLKLRAEPSRWGLPVLVFGALMRIGGAYSKINVVAGFSLIVILLGLTLFLFGRKITGKLLFPIVFLGWMIPLPEASITEISYELKTLASELSARVMPYVGVVVSRSGSQLSFLRPNDVVDSLIVDDVCSGLRSMIALLAFGSIFAYITSCPTRKRLELFAASIPCSIIANMARIVAITVVAYFFGSKYATVEQVIPNPFGTDWTIHDATGILIFVVAFIGFFTYEKLLNSPDFRLPRAEGRKKWAYERGGRVILLADNQLDCLLAAGHIAADERIRPRDSETWQRAGELPRFAGSPRSRRLVLKKDDAAREMSFDDAEKMAAEGSLRKDDFIAYAGGSAMMRAGNLPFLRPHWRASILERVGLVALYCVLPVVLFLVVRRDPSLGSLAEGKPGTVLVTIVLWFIIRAALMAGGHVLRLMRHPEAPLPSPERLAGGGGDGASAPATGGDA